MTLVWRQNGKQRTRAFESWEAAAVEGRYLIMYGGATDVAIHEEEA